MKRSVLWMIVVLAVLIGVLLPQYGVPIAGGGLAFAMIMAICCLLPMFLMASSADGKHGGCCDDTDEDRPEERKGAKPDEKKAASPKCH